MIYVDDIRLEFLFFVLYEQHKYSHIDEIQYKHPKICFIFLVKPWCNTF